MQDIAVYNLFTASYGLHYTKAVINNAEYFKYFRCPAFLDTHFVLISLSTLLQSY